VTWELVGAAIAVFYILVLVPFALIVATVSFMRYFLPTTTTRIEAPREQFYSDRR
jgi:hypothetical protein